MFGTKRNLSIRIIGVVRKIRKEENLGNQMLTGMEAYLAVSTVVQTGMCWADVRAQKWAVAMGMYLVDLMVSALVDR